MTKFEEMKEFFYDEKERSSLFFIVVKMDGYKRNEIIVNSYVNLVDKLDYYKKTYRESLEHKHAPIKIVDFGAITKDTLFTDDDLLEFV